VEGVDSFVVGILRHTLAGGEGQIGACCGCILVSLGCEREHDAVSSSTTSRERPVEIGILFSVGYQVFTSASDNLPFERLISGQAVAR
jgi:hypothetical protein